MHTWITSNEGGMTGDSSSRPSGQGVWGGTAAPKINDFHFVFALG
jgi:hypothetical protein